MVPAGRHSQTKAEIDAIAQERIDALSTGDTRVDFANVVSAGLPLRFINATLGIPAEDDSQIHNWNTELFGIDDEAVARSAARPLSPKS